MKMHFLVVAALAGLCSHAAFADPEADFWQQPQAKYLTRPAGLYGTLAEAGDSSARIVRLSGNSHWVNVAYGETVNFIIDDSDGSERSFAWRFDVSPDLNHVDLRDVAPVDFPSENVRVFVGPDPRYGGE
jgi:hypothetical protein